MLMLKLYAAAFLSGFTTMAFEMLLGRALVPYFGGTLYTWGALISTFLLGMSLGFFGGGALSVRHPSSRWLLTFLVAGGALVCLTPLLLERTCVFLLGLFDDVRYGAVIASTAFAFVPALLLAAVSPFCVRLAVHDVATAGSVAGRLSALNTVGSIVGTLGTSFVLVPHFGTKFIFVLLGTTTIAVGLLVGLRPVYALDVRTKRKLASMATVVVALTAPVIAPPPGLAQPGAPFLREAVLESVESEYNNIFVTRRGDELYMTFGYRGSQYVESVFDPTRPQELVVHYTRYMTLGLVYAPKVERAAFVGLGGGRTASYLVRTVPELRLDVAELDKEVIRLAQKYFAVQPSDRFKIFPQDGRVFMTRTPDRFDLVFLDAYRGPFVPFHLLTKEFFALIKSRLTPNGVIVQNVEPTTMLLDSAAATIGSVFPHVDAYDAGGNVVLIGYTGPSMSTETLRQRASKINERYHPLYNPLTLLTARTDLKLSPDAKVLTDDFAPVEMLHTIKRHNEKRR